MKGLQASSDQINRVEFCAGLKTSVEYNDAMRAAIYEARAMRAANFDSAKGLLDDLLNAHRCCVHLE